MEGVPIIRFTSERLGKEGRASQPKENWECCQKPGSGSPKKRNWEKIGKNWNLEREKKETQRISSLLWEEVDCTTACESDYKQAARYGGESTRVNWRGGKRLTKQNSQQRTTVSIPGSTRISLPSSAMRKRGTRPVKRGNLPKIGRKKRVAVV